MITTKVFKSGNSQAVRLPKEFRLDADEVAINRIGDLIMIMPKDDPWHVFSQGIHEIGDDFPKTIEEIEHTDRVDLK